MRKSYVEQARARKQRVIKVAILVCLMVFLSVIAGALFGDSGILVSLQVKAEYERMLQERERLRRENKRLKDEIAELKNNPRKIEALGRTEFGFGKPGEVIFIFPEDSSKPILKYQHPEN